MPKTLAYCRPSPDRSASRGFTLFELIVVLALMALATGLAAPAVVRGLDAARERGVVSDLRVLLEGLPVRAYQSGGGLDLDATTLRGLLPDLPEGWRLELEQPLRYAPSGVAAGGTVRLLIPGREARVWQVAAVSGQVHMLTGRGDAR